MKRACPVRLTDLDAWVHDTATGWGDLPVYKLTAPPELPPLDRTSAEFRDLGLTVARRRDSGTIEAWTQRENTFPEVFPRLLQTVLSSASKEDPREYLPDLGFQNAEQRRAGQFISFSSQIDPGLPVIGPGGRVSLFRSGGLMWVDITVRRKLAMYPSRWRQFRNIYQPYRQEFAPWERQVEVEPLLGYLELSKYELQLFLRPVYVFIFSVSATNESGVAWQTVRVEPATRYDEISPVEGLGNWYSSGGGYE